jgi:hypothetical protein
LVPLAPAIASTCGLSALLHSSSYTHGSHFLNKMAILKVVVGFESIDGSVDVHCCLLR